MIPLSERERVEATRMLHAALGEEGHTSISSARFCKMSAYIFGVIFRMEGKAVGSSARSAPPRQCDSIWRFEPGKHHLGERLANFSRRFRGVRLEPTMRPIQHAEDD